MKKAISISILILSLLTIQIATESTCADNPLLPFLEKFVKKQNNFIKEEAEQKIAKRLLQQEYSEEDIPSNPFEFSEESTDLSIFEQTSESEDTDPEYDENEDETNPKRFLINWKKEQKAKQQAKQKAKQQKQKKQQQQKQQQDGETPLTKQQKQRLQQKLKEQRKLKNKILKQLFDGENLQQIKAATPTIQNGFSICKKSLNNKPSCCTKNHIQKFRKLTRSYFLKKLKNKPKYSKLFKRMDKIFKTNYHKTQCPLKTLKRIYYTIKSLKKVKKLIKRQRNCQKLGVVTSVNLIRGTICQSCMDPSQHENFFDGEGEDLKLRIVPETMDKYKESMNKQFKCIYNTQRWLKWNIRKYLKNVKKNFKKNNFTKCDQLFQDLLKLFAYKRRKSQPDGEKSQPQDGEQNNNNEDGEYYEKCTYNPQFFSDGCLVELEDGEDDTVSVQQQSLRRRMRLLQEQQGGGSFIIDEKGVSGTYEEDGEEQQEMTVVPDLVEIDQQQEEEQAEEELENDLEEEGDEGSNWRDGKKIDGLGSSGYIVGFALIQLLILSFIV